ncbi:FecR family protein [Pedobacter sp. PAMC26386]|nr:FecR family protein [Pedobacter sp. PAMC26386]
MQEKEINEIIHKYKNGIASEEEKALLESWYLQYQEPGEFKYELQDRLEDAEELWECLQHQKPIHHLTLWPKIVAAMLIIALSSIFLLKKKIISPTLSKQTVQQDILPGGNKAVLTLADGTQVSLTDAKNGEIADQSGVQLDKAADGQLVYINTGDKKSSQTPDSNTIATPKGGQFQIHLPDGSRVWLNATSSLKYPVCFVGAKERKVELKGEAYFEVAKDKTKPFIVKTESQEVKVLGTHFNINAYANEGSVKTTLLEGSVQVTSNHITEQIMPGQQAILINNHFNIISVDTQEAIAWKKGNFDFDNADIKTVMRQLSRWYDVQIIYEGELPKSHYSGFLPRNNNISVILNMLKKTGKINFKIDKNTVTIYK